MHTATQTAPRPAAMPEPVRNTATPLRVNWSDELTIETAPTLRLLVRTLLRECEGEIVIDLSRCGYLSEEGVGALLGAHHEAKRHGRALRVLAPAGQPAGKVSTMRIGAMFC